GFPQPWKSRRDSPIPTARLLLYIFPKTYSRKEPSSPPAPSRFRLILRLEKTACFDQPSACKLHGTFAGRRTLSVCQFVCPVWCGRDFGSVRKIAFSLSFPPNR